VDLSNLLFLSRSPSDKVELDFWQMLLRCDRVDVFLSPEIGRGGSRLRGFAADERGEGEEKGRARQQRLRWLVAARTGARRVVWTSLSSWVGRRIPS
jgi:hypothetical protein